MIIAVTYDNGEIFQHFGHTESFKIYEIEDGEILEEKVVDTNGSGHGALAEFLGDMDTDILICGGIGAGAINALAMEGITVYGGVQGSVDEAIAKLIDGSLSYNSAPNCNHHDSEHSCGNCGSGGCGGHGCH